MIGSDKVKKIFKSLIIVFTIIFLLCPMCFSSTKDEVKFKEQIKKEDGSLFEKIIAECIGGIAQTIFDSTTSKDINIGYNVNDSLSPFTTDLWNKTMNWYKIFAIISGILILIAVFILSYKIMCAGMNTARKNEAKESLMRLCFRRYFNSSLPFVY